MVFKVDSERLKIIWIRVAWLPRGTKLDQDGCTEVGKH